MKLLIILTALLWSMAVYATDFRSVAVYTPQPKYPERLGEVDIGGVVKASYSVRHDGTVRDIQILESSHPGFSVEVISVLERWRFKPWKVTGSRPSEIQEKVSIAFTLDSPDTTKRKMNDELAQWKCSDVNAVVEGNKSIFPDAPLRNMRFFWATNSDISEALIKARISDAEHNMLFDKLEHVLPDIVERCRKNPGEKYESYLPWEIRQFL